MAKKEAAVKTPVTLTTGEVVEFTDRQKSVKSSSLEDGHAKVRFAFRNGEVREFEFGKHHALLMRLAIHGALQKIGDETAGVEEVEDQVEAVEATIARLEAGNWGAERQAASGFAGASIVIRAVCEATGKTPAEVKEHLEKTMARYEAAGTPITRQALYATFRKAGSKTAPIIARMEAERDAKKAAKGGEGKGPSVDDLLGGMMEDAGSDAEE